MWEHRKLDILLETSNLKIGIFKNLKSYLIENYYDRLGHEFNSYKIFCHNRILLKDIRSEYDL